MGVGYLLGRTHKTRWALLLGTAAATGRLGGLSTQVLGRGADVLRSSPELAEITDSAGRLVDAGRAAAVSAMSSRVESLGSRLADRAHGVGETRVNRAGEMSGRLRPPRGRGDSGRGDEEPSDQDRDEADEYEEEDQFDDDEYEDDEYDEGEPDQDDEEDQRHERAPGGRRGSVVRKAGR